MEDLKGLEFLANKSKENIEKQIESNRHKHSNSATVIGIITLFVPFFLNGLANSYQVIKIISIIPILLFVWSIILMLIVLRTKKLYQFFSIRKYADLVNMNYEDILLFEIGANNSSYNDNTPIENKVNTNYNNGIKITTISILFAVILLITNQFFQPEQEPTKIQIINKCMTEQEQPKEEPRVIPIVLPKDREQLNEGVDRPKPETPPNPSIKEKH